MKPILLFVFILVSLIGFTQTNAGPDQSICLGDTTSLQGSGTLFDTFFWTSEPNDPTISDQTILTPTVHPSVTTSYILEARHVSLTNLVVNGDFEEGNMGFTSSYTYSPGPNGLFDAGTYAITNDANFNHNNFFCDEDHTTGSGYFMAVNGSPQANVVVWSETIEVTPNTEYEFSTWIETLEVSNPAILQFSINNVLLGMPFNASNITCLWEQFFEQWNSEDNTSAVISIVNQNTESSGNDFALDDIKFAMVTFSYDTCVVTVTTPATSTFDMPMQICSADTPTITYTGTASPTDQYFWDFDNATIISGSGQGPYQVQWPSAGNHSVQLYVDNNCISDTTTEDIIIDLSPTATLTADATVIPYGTSTILHGQEQGSPGPLTFEWNPTDKLIDPSSKDPTTTPLEHNTLFTFTITDQSSQCAAFDTITIQVTGGVLNILSLTAIPDTICVGDSSNLSVIIEGGSGDYISTWISNPPGFSYSGSENQITVGPAENITYFVEVSDGFATTPLHSVDITVLPQIEFLSQPDNLQIEEGQSGVFTVSANNQNSFQWQESSDNGINWTDLQDDATYSGTKTDQLTISNIGLNYNSRQFRCRLEGKCDNKNSEDAILTITTAPDFTGNLQNISVCQSDNFSVACNISNFLNIDSLYLTFYFDTSLLNFVELDNINDGLANMDVTIAGDSISLYWTSNTSLSINDGRLFDLVFTALNSGESLVDWSNSCKVKNSNGIYPNLVFAAGNIGIMPLPTAAIFAIATPDSISILDEIDIKLETEGGSGDELIWAANSCDGPIVGEGNPLTIFRPNETTTYFAKWETQCGLSECIQTIVNITSNFIFTVPNAFTPNGDEENDKFGIISPNTLSFFEFYIFDRWGQLIFSSKNQKEKWDGKVNGEIAPTGTYTWVANFKFYEDGKGNELHKESGTVTLIR